MKMLTPLLLKWVYYDEEKNEYMPKEADKK